MNPSGVQEELIRAPTAAELAKVHSWTQVSLQRLVDAIWQPATFLAAVIWLYGGTFMDVAVVAMAAAMSYALGSIVMPFALARVDDIRLVLLGAGSVRAAASGIVALIGWRSERFSNDTMVTWIVIGMLFYQVSSAANVHRNPRSFIANQDQPTSARSRQVVGAVAGVIGGLVAWRALGNSALSFQSSAGMLLFLGGFAGLGAVWFQVTAPVRYQDLHQRLPVPPWSDIERVLQHPEFRRYLGVRTLIGMAALVDPFLIIFGMQRMQFGLWYVGAAVATVVLAQVIGGALWTFFGELTGSRKSIQMAALLRFAALTLAVAVPFMATSDWYASTFESRTFANWCFVGVFFLLGLAQNTITRNEQHYAMQRLRDGKLFTAADMVLNIVVVVTSLSMLVGVLLINATSMQTTVAIAAGVAFVAFVSTGFLASRRKRQARRRLVPDLRAEVHPVANRAERTSKVKIKRIKK